MALQAAKLPEEASSAWAELEEWLLGAIYLPYGNLKLCSDLNLVEQAAKLLEHLPEDIKRSFNSPEHDTRMIAIHFDEPGSSVPVQEGSNVLLIPFAIQDGAKIDGRKLERLEYLSLTEEAPAEPGFYALLVMCRL